MRSVVLYGLLVGLPITGTVAVMQFGRDLNSAPAVAGVWAVDTTGASDLPQCPAATALQQARRITISQAGPRVWLSFVGQPGILVRGLVTPLSGTSKSGATLEGTADGLAVRVTVDRAAQPMRLQGEVRFPGCGTVERLPVTATLVPSGEKS